MEQIFKKPTTIPTIPGSKEAFSNAADKGTRRSYGGGQWAGLNAFQKHQKFVNEYILHYGREKDYKVNSANFKTDKDVLKDTYKFIRNEEDNDESTWEKRLAKKYYDKLFKEYCLADMSRYKEGKIGLRWRTQNEVFSGKGQFVCGNKQCDSKEDLKSYEVNFAYVEEGEKKNALVKLRVCPECGYKLHYKKIKQAKKEQRKLEKKMKKLKKRKLNSGDSQQLDLETSTTEQPSEAEISAEQLEQQKRAEELAKEQKMLEDAWKQKPTIDKSKDEEFEEYFDGLFM